MGIKVFSICEIGVNHEGCFDKAFRMVYKASVAGASAVKFQKYDPPTVLGKDSPYLKDAHQLSWDELKRLSDESHRLGMQFGVSVFNTADVLLADEIVDFHKVATRMNKNTEFLQTLKQAGKPIYMSIQAKPFYEGPLVKFLWCVPKYPSLKSEVLVYPFNDTFGISSHCPDYTATTEAIKAGARVIENHVCESKEEKGCDIASSLDFDSYTELLKCVS